MSEVTVEKLEAGGGRVTLVHVRQVVAAAVAIGMLVAPASAQKPQGDPSKDDVLHAYEQLVTDYQAGEDTTVQTLESWPRRQTETAVTRIDHDGDEWRPWTAAERIAAAMLHTDTAVRRFAEGDRQATRFHLGLAGDLLLEGSDKTRAERQVFAARWYAAAGRWLRVPDAALAEYFLERGRDRLPVTVAILYQSALVATDRGVAFANLEQVQQHDAEAVSQEWAMGSANRRESGPQQSDRVRAEALGDADKWLAEAVRMAPAEDGPRLHYAYVLLLRGHEREAIEQAAQVQKRTRDPRLAYLAALLAGAASEGRHEYAAAAGFYRAATLTWPRGQHAYIALSESLARQGMRAQAAEVLQRLLAGPTRIEFDDPWWDFVVGGSEETDTFADLRQEARQ